MVFGASSGLIRKLTYWYVRFLTDQFNLFAGVLIRHLRNLEARLGRMEGPPPVFPSTSLFLPDGAFSTIPPNRPPKLSPM